MGRFIRCGVLVGAALSAWACGSSKQTTPSAALTCEPGARRCDGLTVKVCDDDGAKETIEATCAGSCAGEGECAETICAPNTRFCKDSAVYKCNSSGSSSLLTETCTSRERCVEGNGDADCADLKCTAGAAVCDGSVATKCAADGSGPRPGGTDCKAKGEACVDGACQAQSCKPGSKLCEQGNVYLCNGSGTGTSLLAECGTREACDGDLAACRPKVCEPSKLACDGPRAATCNAYGTGWVAGGTDCASRNELCVGGSCRKQTCTAYAEFCKEGNVHSCDAAGVSSQLHQVCDPEYSYCEQYSSYATCSPNACKAGEKLCHGNVIKTCTAMSTYPDTGTVCDEDSYCEDAECKPRACDIFEYYCEDGDIYYCEDYGGTLPGQLPQQVCPSETECKKLASGVACVAVPCHPGATSCVGNQVGTCASDGSGLSKVTDDCASAGNVCDVNGKCAKTVEDTVGLPESSDVGGSGDFMGNVFEVTAARKLTEIGMSLVLAVPRQLRWVIFEQTGDIFVARIDKVVNNQTSTGFISSGPLSYALKAGKRYLVGVAVTGGDAVSYYDGAPWVSTISFGTTFGGLHTFYSAQISADFIFTEQLYQMRLTTEAL